MRVRVGYSTQTTAREGYPVIRSLDVTLPREPRFNFYGAPIAHPRVATLPRGPEPLRPQWSRPRAVAVSHKKRKIEGRVTPALCNLSLRVRVRSTATARREFRPAVSLSLNYSLTRVPRDGRRQVQRGKERTYQNNGREWREATGSSQHGRQSWQFNVKE